jgi:hypothetical protein
VGGGVSVFVIVNVIHEFLLVIFGLIGSCEVACVVLVAIYFMRIRMKLHFSVLPNDVHQ